MITHSLWSDFGTGPNTFTTESTSVGLSEKAILVPSGTGTNFGYSVSMTDDGSRCIVGAYGSNEAYVYQYDDQAQTWTQMQILKVGDAIDRKYGFSVSINGDGTRCVVGCNDSYREAYVYKYNNSTWNFEHKFSVTGVGVTDYYGKVVSISGDGNSIIIACDKTMRRVFVYRYIVENDPQWTLEATLTSSDYYFGNSVAINYDGTECMVGANSAKKLSIYKFNGTTWVLGQTIAPATNNGGFSEYIKYSRNCNKVIVSAMNNKIAYIYAYDGSTWVEEGTVTTTDTTTTFGKALAMNSDGTKCIVCSSSIKKTYIFTLTGGTWSETDSLTPSDDSTNFGWSCDMTGDGLKCIIGVTTVKQLFTYS